MFRARFTIRTLAILLTLVCAYFAAWEATKRSIARKDQREIMEWEKKYANDQRIKGMSKFIRCDCPAPFVMARNELNGRCYYIWLISPKIKLPF